LTALVGTVSSGISGAQAGVSEAIQAEVISTVKSTLPKFFTSSIPPAVTGLSANGAFTNVVVSWDAHNYVHFSFTEIWRSSTNVQSTAVLIGTSQATVFGDEVGYNKTYHYWVRLVSASGNFGPFAGPVEASTSINIAAVLAGLGESILSSSLSTELQTEIGKIGGISDNAIAVGAAQTTASDAAAVADGQVVGFFQPIEPGTEDEVLGYNADTDVLSVPSFGDIWIKTDDNPVNINSVYRYENSEGGSSTSVEDPLVFTAAPQSALGLVYLEAYNAQSTADSKITTHYGSESPTGKLGDLWVDTSTDGGNAVYRHDGSDSDPWIKLTIATEAHVSAEITESRGYCTYDNGTGSTDSITVKTNYKTKTACEDPENPGVGTYAWNDLGALANTTHTVQTTAGLNTASVQTVLESVDGIEAQYTVKLGYGNMIAGFGLIGEGTGNTDDIAATASEFMVRADRFSILPPAIVQNNEPEEPYEGMIWVNLANPPITRYYVNYGSLGPDGVWSVNLGWTTDKSTYKPLFVVQTNTMNPNQTGGVTQAGDGTAGVYMNTAYIEDASITSAKIGTLSADDISVTNLAAIHADMGDIVAGTLTSADGKMVVDLGNNYLRVSDSSGVRVKIGKLV
jgi:hypothetical protein